MPKDMLSAAAALKAPLSEAGDRQMLGRAAEDLIARDVEQICFAEADERLNAR